MCLSPAPYSYDLTTYPIMCMAYLISNTTAVNMIVDISGVGSRNVAMTLNLSSFAQPPVAAWSIGTPPACCLALCWPCIPRCVWMCSCVWLSCV